MWLQNDFIPIIQKRGAEVIKHAGHHLRHQLRMRPLIQSMTYS